MPMLTATSAMASPLQVQGADEAHNPDQTLGRQIHDLWQRSRGCQVTSLLHQEIRESLQRALDSKWPGQGLRLQPFGSTQNGLGLLSSDLDLVLVDPSMPGGRWTAENERRTTDKTAPYLTHQSFEQPLPEWYTPSVLADALRDVESVCKVTAISSARVPIVRLEYLCGQCPDTVIEVDISINNLFCLYNSDLIRSYAALRPNSFPPLFFAVKHWLKKRGLNDPSGRFSNYKSLSSYAIAMVVIQFLQISCDLPNLQEATLVSLLPTTEQKHLHSANDPRSSTLNQPRIYSKHGESIGEHTKWDVTFVRFAQDSTHTKHTQLIEQSNRRIIVSNNANPQRLPDALPNFQLWDQQHATLRQEQKYQTLPSPQEVGMHMCDPTTLAEVHCRLGTLFVDFLGWFDDLLSHRKVVDISRGRERNHNTNEGEELCRRGLCVGSKDRQQPEYEPDDPLEWQDHALVIADPFIRHQNVARNVSQPTREMLQYEVRRARRLLREQGADCSYAHIASGE